MLHVDVARLARFNRPGHAVTGVRDLTGAEKRARVGYVYLHCVIDDHSRYAYVEQHRDQGGDTAAAVLDRAIGHFRELGLGSPEAVMSDNAFAYRKSRAFREVLTRNEARHMLTPAIGVDRQWFPSADDGPRRRTSRPIRTLLHIRFAP